MPGVVYECAECGERTIQRRCEDCNLFTRELGPGGPCPECDQHVLITELLNQNQDQPVPTYTGNLTSSVERQVLIVREHVLTGRAFDSLTGLDAAFAAWLPIRRAQTHRSHGEVIAVRGERDRDALLPLPAAPYRVVDRHLRRVGKDCLLSFGAARYSVPATEVTAGMRVELRVTPDTVAIHATGPDPRCLAEHRRAARRGDDQINPRHWDGLPDGSTRATTTDPPCLHDAAEPAGAAGKAELAVVLAHRAKLATPVARRDPGEYDRAAGLTAAGGVG